MEINNKFRALTLMLSLTLAACSGSGEPDVTTPTQPPGTGTQPDTTAPVITLAGETSITLEQGQAFADPGASASDNIDGTL